MIPSIANIPDSSVEPVNRSPDPDSVKTAVIVAYKIILFFETSRRFTLFPYYQRTYTLIDLDCNHRIEGLQHTIQKDLEALAKYSGLFDLSRRRTSFCFEVCLQTEDDRFSFGMHKKKRARTIASMPFSPLKRAEIFREDFSKYLEDQGRPPLAMVCQYSVFEFNETIKTRSRVAHPAFKI